MSPADQKIANALRRIEQAQTLLDMAASDLSPVIGMVREWEAVCKESGRVKTLWHKVNGAWMPGRRLDSEL